MNVIAGNAQKQILIWTIWKRLVKMEKNIIIWVGVFLIAYFFFKAYLLLIKQGNVVDKEMKEILDSNKHKVKGQYD